MEHKISSESDDSEKVKFAEQSSVIISSETEKELEESNEIENFKKVEAALFLSARFLSLQELVMLTDVNPLMIREIIVKVIEKYNNESSAIEIIAKKDMWKMDVRQEYVHMVNKLATGSSEFTKAEQETLAVIAYKQPVKQSVVIKIRGNKAYEHIKHFREIGLLIGKKVGHTLELRLSDDFFDYFHLVNRNAINDDYPNSKSSEEFGSLQNRNGKTILDNHPDSEETEEKMKASSLSDDNENFINSQTFALRVKASSNEKKGKKEHDGKIIAVETKDENEGENNLNGNGE